MLRILARPTLAAASLLALGALACDPASAAAPAPIPQAQDDTIVSSTISDYSDYSEPASQFTVACRPRPYGRPDLFYNFYAPPTCGGVGVQLYVAPRPVPPLVGHTYYTYQPLMPHEMLYKHYRTYHRHYDNGRGLTRTRVIWW